MFGFCPDDFTLLENVSKNLKFLKKIKECSVGYTTSLQH